MQDLSPLSMLPPNTHGGHGEGGHGNYGHCGGGRGRGGDGGGRNFLSGIFCQICGKEGHMAHCCFKCFDECFTGPPPPQQKECIFGDHFILWSGYKLVHGLWHSELDKLTIHDKYHGNDHVHATNGSSMEISHVGHSTLLEVEESFT